MADRFITEFKGIMEALPQEAAEILQGFALCDFKTIEWVYADGNAQKSIYRAQALQSYPLLFPLFLGEEDKHKSKEIQEEVVRSFFGDGAYGAPNPHSDFEQIEQRADDWRAFVQKRQKIRDAIDNAEPIKDMLPECLIEGKCVSDDTIRTLGKIKTTPDDYMYACRRVLDDLHFFEAIDHNHHPKTEEELRTFLTCIDRAAHIEKMIGRPAILTLKSINGKWDAWAEKTGSKEELDKIKPWLEEIRKAVILPTVFSQLPHEIVEIFNEPEKFIQEAARKAISELRSDHDLSPHERFNSRNTRAVEEETSGVWEMFFDEVIYECEEKELLKKLLDGVSELDMLACAHRLQEQKETYEARKLELGVTNSLKARQWLPLTPPVKAPNGIWLTALTSLQELEKHAEAVNNCLGWNGYDAKCMLERDHIISLSDGLTGVKSTLQLREEFNAAGEVDGLYDVAHEPMKIGGLVPQLPRKHDDAAAWYISEIFRNAALTPDWDALEEERRRKRQLNKQESRIGGHIGFDPLSADKRKAALEAIKDYLPKPLKKLSYADCLPRIGAGESDFVEKTELGKLIVSSGVSKELKSASSPSIVKPS